MEKNRSDTTTVTIAAILTATVMIAHHVAGKATRDALFLTLFNVELLPRMMMVSAFLSVVAVLSMSRLMTRLGPAWLVPRIFMTSGILFSIEWLLMDYLPSAIAIVLYLHVTVLGAILISGFWSVINERFDPYTAKRKIARLAAAATLGGLLGGLAAKTVAGASDLHAVLMMLGIMHLFCALTLAVVTRGEQRHAQQGKAVGFILAPLKNNTLIRRMAIVVVLIAIIVALLDYLMKSMAASTLSDDQLINFFSYFYMAVGLGGFLLQGLVGDKALRRFGIGGTMAVLPLVVMAGGLFAIAIRQLITVALLRGGTSLLVNSFFRAGSEAVYTPVPAAEKRTSKILIDVGVERTGEMIGSLLVMVILLVPVATGNILLITSILLAALTLFVIYMLHQGYVQQLAENLRNGTLQADDIKVMDATTRHTIALTQTALERDTLLREISLSRQGEQPAANPGQPVPPAESGDPTVQAIVDLRSQDPSRISRVLIGQALTPALLPHVIPLLAEQRVLRDVFRSIRPQVSTATGQLVDALLDHRQYAVIRRRLPLVLSQADNQRAVDGLLEGLADTDRDVRYRCGQALRKISENHPQLRIPKEILMKIVEREVGAMGQHEPDRETSGTDTGRTGGHDPLSHVFNLLGLVYGPDVFELCYQALGSGNRALSGTALEYLDNLLPPALRTALWPHIASGQAAPKSNRPIQEMATELRKAAPTLRTRQHEAQDSDIFLAGNRKE